MNSAQQPSCDSEVTSNKQGTSSEADTSTSQGTSCLRQSDFPEVIDLTSTQYTTPTTTPDSVQLSAKLFVFVQVSMVDYTVCNSGFMLYIIIYCSCSF